MLEAYSVNYETTADAPVEFETVSLRKGCTVTPSGAATFNLNKCGVYMVSVDASAAASVQLQLYKDGVAVPQAQATGVTPSFTTLVQVNHNNTECCCSSPVSLQVLSSAATTLTNANISITKVC